jgi:hypothetical protein
MKRNKLIEAIETTSLDAPETASPLPLIKRPHRLRADTLRVLRLVQSRDPFRRLDDRPMVKSRRLATLEFLKDKGLIRFTLQKFWRVTPLGAEMLLRNPVRYRRHGK